MTAVLARFIGGSDFLAATVHAGPYGPGTWTLLVSMNAARDSHTATLLPNGQLLVAGGYGSSGYLKSTELYNPTTGNWTTTGSMDMTLARDFHTATLLNNGQVLVTGGAANSISPSSAVNSAELYQGPISVTSPLQMLLLGD